MEKLFDFRYVCGRDNYTCVYCLHELDANPHISIVDTSPGIGWTSNNVVLSCQKDGCDRFKNGWPTTPNLPQSWRKGRLVVISAPMYGGKTTLTQSLLHKYTRIKGKYVWVKPHVDTRGEGITTHNEELFEATVIDAHRPDRHLKELLEFPIVAFDEVQFYSERILYVVHQLLKYDKLVIVNGLRLDARRSLFGMTHFLMGEADDIISLKSICDICNTIDVATRTKLRNTKQETVQIGGIESYYAVCAGCDTASIV